MRILYAKVEVEARESSKWVCVIVRPMSNKGHVQQAGSTKSGG